MLFSISLEFVDRHYISWENAHKMVFFSSSDSCTQLSPCQTNFAAVREKQVRFFRQLETKADAKPQKLRRSIQPMAGLPQDTEVKTSGFFCTSIFHIKCRSELWTRGAN